MDSSGDEDTLEARPDLAPNSHLPLATPSRHAVAAAPPLELETIAEEQSSATDEEDLAEDSSAPVSPLPGPTCSRRLVSVPPRLETIPENQPETTDDDDDDECVQAFNEISLTLTVPYLGVERPSRRRAGVVRPGFETVSLDTMIYLEIMPDLMMSADFLTY